MKGEGISLAGEGAMSCLSEEVGDGERIKQVPIASSTVDPCSYCQSERFDIEVEMRVTEEQVKREGQRPVLLVMGQEVGPFPEHDLGQGQVVMQACMLDKAILWPRKNLEEAAWDAMSPVPRWGGINVPDAHAARDSEGENIEPYRLSMVFRGRKNTKYFCTQICLHLVLVHLCHSN